jgi:o-succinylbenzoate synthase
MEWLQQQHQQGEGEGGLLPSVRAGVEMALVHVLAQEYRVGLPAVLTAGNPSHLLHTGQVCMNGLVLRSSSSSSGGGSRKVKVGGRPVPEDITRINTMTAALAPGHRLRLDANQSWSLEEVVAFIRGLAQPERIEYLEEPCQDPLTIPELFHLTEQRVTFALDETLASPPRPLSELVGMTGLAALVLKPTVLGGLKVCLDLHALGSAKGLLSVVSSSFESSVGLAHLTVLASVLNSGSGALRQSKTGGVHTLHGLSTYDVFAREEGEEGREGGGEGYGRLVTYGSRSVLVDVLGCGELLDGCVKKMKHGGRWRDGGVEDSVGTTTSVGKEEEEEAAAPERAGRETSDGKRNDSL